MSKVQRFRKKPVIIEAMQFNGANAQDIFNWGQGEITVQHRWLGIAIETLEGSMVAVSGDWIIKGVKGEFYPCKPDIFEATYEPVGATIEVRASGPYVVADPNASASPPGDDEYGLAKDYEQMADHLPPGGKL